ncbi:hypothetical protein GC169_06150 [bacterium]|nr:hypothetical protein [bacterium]
MRGLWESEQPLAPGTLRTTLTALTVLLVFLAAAGVLGALGALFSGRILAALIQAAGSLAVPLAIYLVVRIQADLLILQHWRDAGPDAEPAARATTDAEDERGGARGGTAAGTGASTYQPASSRPRPARPGSAAASASPDPTLERQSED